MKNQEQFKLIGKRIKMRRKELGMMQIKLAELLEISNNHMSAIENGRENPSLDKLISLCEILKTTPDFLILGITHSNNIPQSILAGLQLCSDEDIQLAAQIIELLIHRNQKQWSSDNFV